MLSTLSHGSLLPISQFEYTCSEMGNNRGKPLILLAAPPSVVMCFTYEVGINNSFKDVIMYESHYNSTEVTYYYIYCLYTGNVSSH